MVPISVKAGGTGPSASSARQRAPLASGGWGRAGAAGLALFLAAGCAGRPRPILLPPPGSAETVAEMRRGCPSAVSASVRIRLEPEGRSGVTINGTLRAILPDTLALSARLGVFRPFFALRADADSAELLLHDARQFWVTARADEDWRALNPSAWARALAWALCPADLLDRLDGLEPSGGDGRIRRVRGRLRGSPFLAELGIERRTARLVSLRLAEGTAVVLELKQQGFHRYGDVWIPGVVELRMPRHGLSAAVEILKASTSRPDRPPAVERLRPPAWGPVAPGEPLFTLPGRGQDPG
jgi:hypothetical protein